MPDVVPGLLEKVDLNIAYLLSAMSQSVGAPVEQLHILRGAYAPQGWADEEEKQKSLRDQVQRLLSGEIALPVVLRPPLTPTDEGGEAPAPTEASQPKAVRRKS